MRGILGYIWHKRNNTDTLFPNASPPRGRVLFSYLKDPVFWKEGDKRFDGHTNKWESRQIARLFLDRGYIVDVIDWQDKTFVPTVKYDLVFDISTNIVRLKKCWNQNTVKILHLTGSYAPYQNEAETNRIKALKRRHQYSYEPKRVVGNIESYLEELNTAKHCSLIGNKHTLLTFPGELQKKITPIRASSSRLSYIKNDPSFTKNQKHFLWFSGGGAVHKGLDLALEVFSKRPEFSLHIVGSIEEEQDFVTIYEKELFHTSNIIYHGYTNPASKKFRNIVKKCFCVLGLSCSEGTSTAGVTCLQIGLYPIYTPDMGIDLPDNMGKLIKDVNVSNIEKTIEEVYNYPDQRLANEIKIIQGFALKEHSRKRFIETYNEFLTEIKV